MSRILNGIARPTPESTRQGGPARRNVGLFGENAWETEPRIAFLLSFFFPGAGHAYAGRWGRGAVWTVLYLGIVLPAWIFSYMVCAPFGGSGVGLALALLAFLLLSGRGASALSSRGQRARRIETMGTVSASLTIRRWLLGSYALVLLLVAGLEFFVFLESCLSTATVRTSSMEPLLPKGAQVKVLLSSYVRPVHGDVVLFRSSSPKVPDRTLGRVLAKPGDTLSFQGELLVNGLGVDLERNDQRWALEQAGRKERRQRLLFPLPLLQREGPLPWREGSAPRADWGPFRLPKDLFLVIPDSEERSERRASKPEERWTEAILVPKRDTLGRVLF